MQLIKFEIFTKEFFFNLHYLTKVIVIYNCYYNLKSGKKK